MEVLVPVYVSPGCPDIRWKNRVTAHLYLPRELLDADQLPMVRHCERNRCPHGARVTIEISAPGEVLAST